MPRYVPLDPQNPGQEFLAIPDEAVGLRPPLIERDLRDKPALNDEVRAWCSEHIGRYRFGYRPVPVYWQSEDGGLHRSTRQYAVGLIEFDREGDEVAFRLRWG